jgi:hypothetical protein
MKELLEKINELKLPAPKVGHQFQFSEMDKALELFKSGNTVGKVVVNI